MDNDDCSRDDYTTHILKAIGWSWFANRPQETNLRIAELEAEVKRLREANEQMAKALVAIQSTMDELRRSVAGEALR